MYGGPRAYKIGKVSENTTNVPNKAVIMLCLTDVYQQQKISSGTT